MLTSKELTRETWVGCVRKVFNMALAARSRAWTLEHRRVSYVETSAMLTEWKRTEELAFLAQVSSVPLQQCLRHLQTAYTAFFDKRARHPRFKSKKRSKDSAEYTRSAFRFHNGELTLAKMRDPLAVVWSRPLPEGAEPSTVTVSRDRAGRWFVALLMESTVSPGPVTDAAVGLDAGLTSLLTLSTGEKITNPKFERKDRSRLAKTQRELSRKVQGSRNRHKARVKVARVHARISDRRRDFLHKLTTRLVRENQTIVIEDLTVRSLLGNRTLARAISDASWTELRSLLEYKCAWYGRELITIDRFFPSSRTCSTCGLIHDELPLGVRRWTCAGCGAQHDRDHNAAKTILAAGLAVSACGAGVRPQRSASGRAVGDEAGSVVVRTTAGPSRSGGAEVNR
ncbi:RNA-guided endonuclease TnpB family protein [Streptomyces sp. NPDC021562]|uniref:RNA-guided endonuclease InsQ/TnpB family protein n=1 Tax=Streptomyces sp. NPDC021562 TaxID=3155121 RepID=UPI0010E4A0CC